MFKPVNDSLSSHESLSALLLGMQRVNLLEEPQDAQGLPVPTRSGSELKGPIPGAPERGLLNFAPQAVQVRHATQ